MRIVILGSGIIGVATAWFAARDGHEVVVVDRQSGPAQETSFANGCQISVSYAEPWASPGALVKMVKWLGKEDAPLLFRPRPEMAQWLWGLHFLRECLPGQVEKNVRQLVGLCSYSRDVLRQVRRDTGIQYDELERGILNIYTSNEDFAGAQGIAKVMQNLGCDRQVISKERVQELEPSLRAMANQIVGGDFTSDDETGDIYLFTTRLVERAKALGVQFLFNHEVTRLVPGATRTDPLAGVELIDEFGHHRTLTADAYVVAMGSYTPELVRPFGLRLPIYPVKGYSATLKVINPDAAPMVSVSDSAYKMVFTRIGKRLRVAGTAELNGFNRELNPVRCVALTNRAKTLFPGACDYDNPQYWTGLRPTTPSNIPFIGPTHVPNLYLNAGHGTLGWTMGCGSGKAMADILSGRTPDIDFRFIGGVKGHKPMSVGVLPATA
jgi:D-amino-acid dehydrogenase